MMRSLFSGVSGLRNHQTRMDVIGNNISNVNTVGYKSSRVVFQDIFSQNIAAGMAHQGVGIQGGTNPIQVGLGMSLGAIDVIHTRSAFQRTDRPTDMMINGDGFFVVRGPDGDFFTRAGNFSIDDEGFLVNPQGFFVMGYEVPTDMGIIDHGRPATEGIPTAEQAADWFDGTDTNIPGDLDLTLPAGFFRVGDLIPPGSLRVPGANPEVLWPPAEPAEGFRVRAADGMVPSIPMEVATGFPLNRRIGAGSIESPRSAIPPRFGLVPTGDGPDLGTLRPIRMIMPGMPIVPSVLGPEIIDQIEWDVEHFEETGEWIIDWDAMDDPIDSMDGFFSELFPMGDLSLPNFMVADNGDVSILSGGRNVVIAQVAVAMFANPEGLEAAGGNLFRQTASSGEALIGQAGLDGAGAINGGGLEMSNVDMADQFTDMIVTQRGFQANSRIISVTDEMLQELVNLRR